MKNKLKTKKTKHDKKFNQNKKLGMTEKYLIGLHKYLIETKQIKSNVIVKNHQIWMTHNRGKSLVFLGGGE